MRTPFYVSQVVLKVTCSNLVSKVLEIRYDL